MRVLLFIQNSYFINLILLVVYDDCVGHSDFGFRKSFWRPYLDRFSLFSDFGFRKPFFDLVFLRWTWLSVFGFRKAIGHWLYDGYWVIHISEIRNQYNFFFSTFMNFLFVIRFRKRDYARMPFWPVLRVISRFRIPGISISDLTFRFQISETSWPEARNCARSD